MNRFQYYNSNILSRDYLLKTNGMNIMQVPQFSKIVVNTSLGAPQSSVSSSLNQSINSKEVSLIALEMICGQKLKKTRSKKFIAGFKLRKNQLIACKVTLRRIRMFSFLEKLILVVFPKLRDFQGLGPKDAPSKTGRFGAKLELCSQNPKGVSSIAHVKRKQGRGQNINSSFDDKGNISFGLENFLLFPELENHYELFGSLKGCQIILGTTAKNPHEARLLLSANQVPFF